MPVHDWSSVDAGVFHDFHTVWIGAIRTTLNKGILPEGYYALAEQHASRYITDVLTLHTGPEPGTPIFLPPISGGTAVADAPPKVRRKLTIEPAGLARRRTLAIRHVSGHRLVALLEIISPGNKDRTEHLDEFAAKAVSALEHGVHLLVIDLFPPGRRDPEGIHGVIGSQLAIDDAPYELPSDEPLTLAAYVAGAPIEVWLEHSSVGADLPDMPLFLRPDRYVNVPLESTYRAAYEGVPRFWCDVLEGRQFPSSD